MTAIRRLRRPLLAALLVIGMVSPLGWRGEVGAAAEPRTTTRTVTIPASAFTPMSDIMPYSRGAGYVETRSGSGTFLAPVFFEAPVVTIRKVVFYAIDGGSGTVIMDLLRTQLAGPTTVLLGEATTTGSSYLMQVITLSDLSDRRISGAYGATLSIYLPGPYTAGYRFLGAKVTYSY